MSVSVFLGRPPAEANDGEPRLATPGRRLGLIAAEPGEGFARAVLAYARDEVQRGSRVVVVEADGSWPCLAKLGGVPASPGLAELLAGSSAPREAVHRGSGGIDCLPFGDMRNPEPQGPGEPGLPAILDLLAQRYDRVLVVCPALSEAAAAPVLAARLDGYVVVVGAERTRRRAVERALRDLEAAGATVIGTILQDCRRPLPDWIERWLP